MSGFFFGGGHGPIRMAHGAPKKKHSMQNWLSCNGSFLLKNLNHTKLGEKKTLVIMNEACFLQQV